jgi:hypothetical protein
MTVRTFHEQLLYLYHLQLVKALVYFHPCQEIC